MGWGWGWGSMDKVEVVVVGEENHELGRSKWNTFMEEEEEDNM